MKLSEYLLRKQITSEAFAKKMKVSISSVNKWRMDGYRIPRPNLIAKIDKATSGSVKLRDWYL
jgi:transcriptional regulator with XRE-family HTH domain